jgi:ABC-type tungstate transport system substrate-binding protein
MNNELLDQLVEALVAGLILVMPVVFAVVANALRNLLKQLEEKAAAQVGAEKWAVVKNMAWEFVLAASQMEALGTNDQKREWAINMLLDGAAAANVPMDYMQAEALVEAAVKALKIEVGRGGDAYP